MDVSLWYCDSMKQWRYIVCDGSRPIVKQESGQNDNLDDTMNEIRNILESMSSHK